MRAMQVVVSALLGLTLAADRLDAQSGVVYTVTDLGTLGGNYSQSAGINDNGEVVGYSSNANGENRGFKYSNGNMIDLGTLGGTGSEAFGINNNGDVVGFSNIANNAAQRGFLYTNANISPLGTLGGTNSAAQALNANGLIVGYSSISGDTSSHAFLYSNGNMMDLGVLSGGTYSAAYAINDSGQIVGAGNATGFSQQAFLYANGVMTGLGSLGGYYSEALAINSSGQIVGDSNLTGNNANHAFLYSGGNMIDLGSLGGTQSSARGINDSGVIVGGSYPAGNSTYYPFVYSNGVMTNLNDLLLNDTGFYFGYATGINNSGQIALTGKHNGSGSLHAFLLTPVPVETWTFNWPNRNTAWTRILDDFHDATDGCDWPVTSRQVGPLEFIHGPITCTDEVPRTGFAVVTNRSLTGFILQRQFFPIAFLHGQMTQASVAKANPSLTSVKGSAATDNGSTSTALDTRATTPSRNAGSIRSR